ncbi:hypothetical protein SEA_ANON_95 [Gordonia phage Anon]|nr:hypothetical protein SEA_ANON_95 [Gordonia phage Anon]
MYKLKARIGQEVVEVYGHSVEEMTKALEASASRHGFDIHDRTKHDSRLPYGAILKEGAIKGYWYVADHVSRELVPA